MDLYNDLLADLKTKDFTNKEKLLICMVMDNFDNNDAKYQEVELISCKQTIKNLVP